MSDTEEPPMRGEGGRFLPGHKSISPGRPPKNREAEYLNATMTACPPDRWGEIVAAAVADCTRGRASERRSAREFLLKALFGTSPGALVQIANVQTGPTAPVRVHPAELRRIVSEVYGVELPDNGAETLINLRADTETSGQSGLSAVTVDALRRAMFQALDPAQSQPDATPMQSASSATDRT